MSRDRYRYLLTRGPCEAREHVVFVMLNPSTADQTHDDATIRKVRGFADRLGFERLSVVNLFALRATEPARLYRARDPVGPGNDDAIRAAVADATLVIAAWGNHGALRDRAAEVLPLLPRFFHFGLTRLGQPRHPLYLPYGAGFCPQNATGGGSRMNAASGISRLISRSLPHSTSRSDFSAGVLKLLLPGTR
jgi:hypothetical protein